MKRLTFVFMILLTISCQKVELTKEKDGRNAMEEPNDSSSVTPTFEAEDWEGVIDVNFGFG